MNAEAAEHLLAEAAQLFQDGKLNDAETACKHLLEHDPEDPRALQLLGFIYFSRGQTEAAIDYLKRAAQIAPENFDAHINLAQAYEELGDMEQAMSSFSAARKLSPNDLNTLDALGRTHTVLGNLEASEACFRRAIELSPGSAACHVNLGNVLSSQRRFEEAEARYRAALNINGTLAPAHNGLGQALLEQGNTETALESIHHALALNPDFIEAHINLGNALKASNRIGDAILSYREALKRDPDNADAHFNLSLALLLAGNFTEGWREYDWRWQWEHFTVPKRNFPQTEWRNEELTGASVIAWGEQGIGDEIMFASLLPDLIQEAATVTLECEPRLLPIFERSFPGISLTPKENPPVSSLVDMSADFQIAVGSLGQRYRQTIDSFPKHDGYLKADPALTEKFKQRYRDLYPGKLLIGFSWKSGNVELGAARSASLDLWRTVFEHPDCAFINLQYGDIRAELKDFTQRTGFEIFDDESVDPLKDMDTFAAQLSALDLIISIDNSTVHLAGALGRPTWTLLPAAPDWRWMLESDDTPWYPSMRLYRRQKIGRWTEVFNDIDCALEKLKTN